MGIIRLYTFVISIIEIFYRLKKNNIAANLIGGIQFSMAKKSMVER